MTFSLRERRQQFPIRQDRATWQAAGLTGENSPLYSLRARRPAEEAAEANTAACSPRLMGATFSAAACARAEGFARVARRC
jgi:hypothetical protein